MIRRELGDRLGIALALGNLGMVALSQGNSQEARSLHEESLAIRRELGDRPGIAETLLNLGDVARSEEEFASAAVLYQESLEINRELGDKSRAATALHHLGVALRSQGEEAQVGAQRAVPLLFAESLDLYRELGEKLGMANCLAGLAGLAVSKAQADRAARLFGAAAAMLGDGGLRLQPLDQADYERNLAATRRILDEATWAALWAEGGAAPQEEATAYMRDA